jgi:uncharacterized protein (DUF952 family)
MQLMRVGLAPPATGLVNNPMPALSLIAGSGLTATTRLTGRDHGDVRWPRQYRGNVPTTIYKICESGLWREAERAGMLRGAPVDLRDGFIHFSTADQVRETAAKHFAGATDLMLVAVDAGAVESALKWEVSRGGDLFPHLYGALPLSAVLWATPLPLGSDRRHVFPELAP